MVVFALLGSLPLFRDLQLPRLLALWRIDSDALARAIIYLTDQPGDVIVAVIPGGFMLGRIPKKRDDAGPWWRYVGAVNTFEEAVRLARAIVTGKMWYHTGARPTSQFLPIHQSRSPSRSIQTASRSSSVLSGPARAQLRWVCDRHNYQKRTEQRSCLAASSCLSSCHVTKSSEQAIAIVKSRYFWC